MTDRDAAAERADARDAEPSFIDSLQGFARMCESGALSPDDGQIIAAKLRDACFVISMQQSELRAYATPATAAPDQPAEVREVVAAEIFDCTEIAVPDNHNIFPYVDNPREVADAVFSALAAAGYRITSDAPARPTVGETWETETGPVMVVPVERRVRHIKRGSTYQVFPTATAQVSKASDDVFTARPYRRLHDDDPLIVYRCEADGHLWVRFPDEMEDDRFAAANEEATHADRT